LNLEVAGDLPQVFADRDRIYQVVTNLIGNAIKFSFEGKEIAVRAERFEEKRAGQSTEWVRLSVADQGVGIDERDVEIIFDKFRQVCTDTLKDKPRGTGLGLPICKDIICHYGGDIWVESRQGRGSTFVFTLPGAPPAAAHAEAQPAAPDKAGLEDSSG
jgi:signal transduction histidine kinase